MRSYNENVHDILVMATGAIKDTKSIEFPDVLTGGYRHVYFLYPWADTLQRRRNNLLMDFVFKETLLLKASKRINGKLILKVGNGLSFQEQQICRH